MTFKTGVKRLKSAGLKPRLDNDLFRVLASETKSKSIKFGLKFGLESEFGLESFSPVDVIHT